MKNGRKAVRQKQKQKKPVSLSAATKRRKSRYISIADVQKWYKPLKKPVTLRLDGDVLAWFKKSGQGYQTRINRALRKVMEEEKRAAGE
jgi:uncharacterized protein (DUF4415 family)